MINRTPNKQRGFSTVELGISATIFAAMAIITTGSMVESIRSTTSAQVDSATVDKTRLGFDRLGRDIQSADMVLARYRAAGSSWMESEDDRLILRIPRFDANGILIPNEYDVVMYIGAGANPVTLQRRVSRLSRGVGSAWSSPEYLVPGLTGLRFDYQATASLRSGGVGSTLSLPGPVVTSDPDDNEIELTAVRSALGRWDDEDPSAPGLGLLAGLRFGGTVRIPPGWENQGIDIRYRIDPEHVTRPPVGNAAGIVVVRLRATTTTREGSVTTRLVSRFNLRNVE